jgi:hypothetical protein
LVLTRTTARLATLWQTGETLLGKELLFPRREGELGPAIHAGNDLIRIEHRLTFRQRPTASLFPIDDETCMKQTAHGTRLPPPLGIHLVKVSRLMSDTAINLTTIHRSLL